MVSRVNPLLEQSMLHQLIFREVTGKDSGVYRCHGIAINDHGNKTSNHCVW